MLHQPSLERSNGEGCHAGVFEHRSAGGPIRRRRALRTTAWRAKEGALPEAAGIMQAGGLIGM